jgi:hypothetical protein
MELFRRLDFGDLCSRRVQFRWNTLVLTFEVCGPKPASLRLNPKFYNLITFLLTDTRTLTYQSESW